jgi:hypothetical protein
MWRDLQMNLEERVSKLEDDVNELKINQAETKIYVKQIFERIEDIKVLFKSGAQGNNETWVKVVLELIKMIAIVGGIIAGMKLL